MPAVTTVSLNLSHGTLFAIPDAGHLRVPASNTITFTADFLFSVEFTALTPTSPPVATLTATSCGGGGGGGGGGPSGYSVNLDLSTLPVTAVAPAYKYTIKGQGTAAGKVLDPIIIVDKR